MSYGFTRCKYAYLFLFWQAHPIFKISVKALYSSYVIFEDVVWGLHHFWKLNWIALEYVNVQNRAKAPEMQVSALCGHKPRNPASIQKSAAILKVNLCSLKHVWFVYKDQNV